MIFIGSKFRDIRKIKKITSASLARQIGVIPMTITNWEKNRSIPRSDHLVAASRLLGVSVDVFFIQEPLKVLPESLQGGLFDELSYS